MADLGSDANGQNRRLTPDVPGVDSEGRLWIFGYGSLIWNPEFSPVSVRPATIYGYHRDFCLHSIEHRGTPERSGLVLGLAPGGACKGLVFEVSAADAPPVLEALDARELVTDAYVPRAVEARCGDAVIRARTYVCVPSHHQFAGRLPVEEAAARIHGAVGARGPNEDYAFKTVEALRANAIKDARLEAIVEAIALKMQA